MRLILILLLVASALPALAQEHKKDIRQGNKHYENQNYTEAEKSYRSALQKKKDSFKAMYNLGNAYYKQGKYKEAAGQFEVLANSNVGRDTLQKVLHNLGNSFLKQKEYQKSIDAYKKALKINPKDEETRYNLAYAQKMLKKEEQQQPKKDQKQEEQEEQEQQEEKQKQQEQKKQQEQDQQRQQQMTKEEAQKMFDALNNEEKDIQKKVKGGKRQGKPARSGKDW